MYIYVQNSMKDIADITNYHSPLFSCFWKPVLTYWFWNIKLNHLKLLSRGLYPSRWKNRRVVHSLEGSQAPKPPHQEQVQEQGKECTGDTRPPLCMDCAKRPQISPPWVHLKKHQGSTRNWHGETETGKKELEELKHNVDTGKKKKNQLGNAQ